MFTRTRTGPQNTIINMEPSQSGCGGFLKKKPGGGVSGHGGGAGGGGAGRGVAGRAGRGGGG